MGVVGGLRSGPGGLCSLIVFIREGEDASSDCRAVWPLEDRDIS